MEEFETEPVVVEAEVTDFVDAPENDLADAAESEGELTEINDGIEEASETGETLEGIQEAMGESLEAGGMPEPEARALEVAVEHMCTRVGFSSRRKVFPAMEGFKEKGADRINATKLAMEEIGSKIKAIWDAIVAALSKAWEHIKAFFKSLVDGAASLKKRAETLEAKAKATKTGHGVDGKKVSTSGFGKVLTVDSKLVQDGALVAAYEKHVADAFVTMDRSAMISKVASDIEKITAGGEGAKELAETVNAELGKAFGSEETSKEGTDAAEGEKVYGHKLTFGNAEFVYVASKTNPKVSIRTIGGDVTIPEQVEALTTEDSGKLAGLVAKHLGTYASSATKVGESINKVTALISKIKNGKSDDINSVKYAGIAVRALNQAVVQSGVVLKGYDVKVAKAALDYVGASLSGLKQEKAPAAAK